jgi:hypothetical protein
MSTLLPAVTVVEHVQLSEFRIKLTGGMPQTLSRISFLDSNSAHVAEALFTAFSDATWEKIKALEKSIEQDFVRLLSVEGNPEHEEQDTSMDEAIRWSNST